MRSIGRILNVFTVVMRRSLVFACLFILTLFAVYTYTRVSGQDKIYAAESTNLNFQARLYDTDGSLVDDGLYNVEFKLFNAVSSSGSSQGSCTGDSNCVWTETRTGGNQVRVTNGYFNVNLGSVNAFPSTIAWDQEHWLTLNVGGTGSPSWDGEMTPRIKLTAVPYAFRAAQAKRLIDSQLNGTGTLEWLTLTANRTISLPNANGTALLDSTGFSNGGNSFGGAATLGTNDSNDLIFETGGVEGLRIDQDGDVGVGTLADAIEALEVNGGIKLGNTSNTNAGTLRWTGSDFEGYNGAQWVSLTSGGGTTVIGTSSTSFVSGVANLAGTASGTATGLLSFTSATAVANNAGSNTLVAPADGSFRTCTLVSNANRTAGTVSVRWSVNGSSTGSAVCAIDGTNVRTSASAINSGVANFIAGDTISVVLDSSGFTPTNTDFTVYWTVDYEGGASGGGDSFVQDGNSFGTIGNLGTSDGFGLNIITNDITALAIGNDQSASFTSSLSVADGLTVDASGITVTAGGVSITADGLTVLSGGVDITGNSTIDGSLSGLTGLSFASGDIDLNGGDITNVGTNITASAGLELASSGAGDLTLTSASGIIGLNGSTLQRVAAGTTSLRLNDSSDTTLSLENAGAGVANLSVDGEVSAAGFNGVGSGLTSLNGSNISSGTLSDARLSSNVALLNGGQTFSALTTFDSGLVLGNTASNTTGAVRFNGSDFEGYDGLQWVSLTSGGSGGSGNVTTVLKPSNETVNNSSTLQNDNDLHFPVGASESWSFRFVVQASSNTTADIKFAVTAPSGSVCRVTFSDPEGATSDGQIGCGVATTTLPGNGATDLYEITGSVTTGVSAGNVTLQWSQDTADPSNTIVYGGSYLNAFPESVYIAPPSTVFVQGGNNFGGTAMLGTADNNGLNLITNGSARLSFLATGEATFSSDVTMSSTLAVDGATTFNGAVTIGNNIADGLTIVSGNVTANNGLNIDSNTLVIDSADNQVGIGTSTPLNTLTINAPSAADTAAQVSIYTNGVGNKGLIIQRAASQTANLFEAQDESGNALAYITNSGGFVLGRSSFTNGSLVFKNSSNAFTSSFAPGALSSDRTITLPDSSGVVCLDSNNCSFTRFAPSSVQADASTNNTLDINKTNATGNILRFQRGGTNVFTVLNSGALEIQLTSTAALNVMNAGGTSLFSVDTTNNAVRVGSITADGTGVQLVLDTKNTSGDPTGINGGQYYNSNSNKFRCFENSEWKNCIGSVSVRSFIDTTADALVDANTTNYWDTASENNNSTPNITLSQSSGRSVFGTITSEITATGNQDTEFTARIERFTGSVGSCGSGTVVGANPSAFTTNTGSIQSSTVTFIDNPNTTSQVFYTLCSDAATVGTTANVTRIRISLQEVTNSN